MTKEENNEKTEEQVLFPEIIIGKYTVKPWSFGMLFIISTLLDSVLERAESKNIINDIEKSDGMLTPIIIAKLFSVCGPEVQAVMAETLNVDKEEINNLDMDTGIKLVFTIFQQNKDIIKNALSPLLM